VAANQKFIENRRKTVSFSVADIQNIQIWESQVPKRHMEYRYHFTTFFFFFFFLFTGGSIWTCLTSLFFSYRTVLRTVILTMINLCCLFSDSFYLWRLDIIFKCFIKSGLLSFTAGIVINYGSYTCTYGYFRTFAATQQLLWVRIRTDMSIQIPNPLSDTAERDARIKLSGIWKSPFWLGMHRISGQSKNRIPDIRYPACNGRILTQHSIVQSIFFYIKAVTVLTFFEILWKDMVISPIWPDIHYFYYLSAIPPDIRQVKSSILPDTGTGYKKGRISGASLILTVFL
jgi:hypothetical protein